MAGEVRNGPRTSLCYPVIGKEFNREARNLRIAFRFRRIQKAAGCYRDGMNVVARVL